MVQEVHTDQQRLTAYNITNTPYNTAEMLRVPGLSEGMQRDTCSLRRGATGNRGAGRPPKGGAEEAEWHAAAGRPATAAAMAGVVLRRAGAATWTAWKA